MLTVFIVWYVLGLFSWFGFLYAEGKITNGDLAVSPLMALTGVMLPVALLAWHGFWIYAAWSDKVIWQRKS